MICISVIITDVEYLLMYLLAIYISLGKKKKKSILVFNKPSPWYRLELETVGLEMMLGVRWELPSA